MSLQKQNEHEGTPISNKSLHHSFKVFLPHEKSTLTPRNDQRLHQWVGKLQVAQMLWNLNSTWSSRRFLRLSRERRALQSQVADPKSLQTSLGESKKSPHYPLGHSAQKPGFSCLFFLVWSLTKTVHFCALLGPDLDQALFDESMCDSTMNIHEQHLLSPTNLPQTCSNQFKWTISLRFAGQK